MPPTILPLASPDANLPLAGGKGANLSRLARAGFSIPPGFIITTRAYCDFVAANHLDAPLQAQLAGLDPTDPASLDAASAAIRAAFRAAALPPVLAQELQAAYAALGSPPVAVRSSATAEDLPEMSFAGQQDTYLNVLDPAALLAAVIDCWSSLWTARAIGYRARNAVPHASVALAVVVQQMVESQASGVLFTANPLSGLRSETVVDATLGLGEALVSGQVEPDHYVVDPAQGRILSKILGAKALSIHGESTGGTRVERGERRALQALPDEHILALARLGAQVADLYAFPQDIEWAWAGGQLSLLQTRPITSLFPLPAGLPAEPLKVFFSFGSVQGMLDPMTPLGRDAICEIFASGSRLFGIHVTRRTQGVLAVAGERLWVNFTSVLTNSVGRRIIPVVFSMVEPAVRQAVEQIWDDPRLQPARPGFSFQGRRRLLHFFPRLAANVLLNLLAPRRRREFIIDSGEQLLKLMETRCAAIHGDRFQKLAQAAALLPDLAAGYLPRTFLLFVSAVASGMASWNFLNMLSAAVQDPAAKPRIRDLVLQVTRGMPFNPTTEMDLALWDMAKILRHDPASLGDLQGASASQLAARYLSGELPAPAAALIRTFLARYGGRGLGEIDLGRPRWAQDPAHVFEMLSSFLQIEDESHAPDVVFARAAGSARQAVDELAHLVRRAPGGWYKAPLLRFFAGRARQLMGARESPKFFAVRMMGLVQGALLQAGAEFVQGGELTQPGDLFYLTFDELNALAARQPAAGFASWSALVASRRLAYQRELLRRQIPRLLLSDGRAFYAGMTSTEAVAGAIHGSPVSPGSVQGRVRVVLDPRQAGLLPGEILVCPGTDPSWTPLFLSAAGLVMETGGLMTHGAVVAREYGIPAVVGVDRATARLHTGQRIQLDGSTGAILLLDDQPK